MMLFHPGTEGKVTAAWTDGRQVPEMMAMEKEPPVIAGLLPVGQLRPDSGTPDSFRTCLPMYASTHGWPRL